MACIRSIYLTKELLTVTMETNVGLFTSLEVFLEVHEFLPKMFTSKEELIDMVELTSPKKGLRLKPKNRNKVHSPPFVSPSHSTQKDVTSLFSVKKSTIRSSFEEDSETISELSDDEVFTLEKSMGNTSKSESIGQSYREKVRERYTNDRKGSSRSTQKPNRMTRVSLERIQKENSEIEANIAAVRNKFKLRDGGQGDRAEFCFFTSEKDDDGLLITQQTPVDSDDHGLKYFMATQMTFHMDLSEQECFFIPNMKPVKLENKLSGEEPRYLEEEGLYVNSIIRLPRGQVNLLEERLLSIEDKKWFNGEGNLNILPTPILNRSLKPDTKVKVAEGTSYAPPKLDQDIEEIIIVKENLLDLSLSTIKFAHHPLFSLEHVLQEKIRTVFRKYSSSVENNSLQKLRNQLEALKHARKIKIQGDKEVTVKDIKRVRESLFREGKLQREWLKSLLELWKSIKKLREAQKYSSTTVKLVIKKEKSDYDKLDSFFLDTLEDILEERRSAFKRRMKEYNRRIRKRDEEGESDEETESVPEKPVYDVDEGKVEVELWGKFDESFKPPGEPNITVLLTDNNEITKETDCDRENSRRKVVSSTKISLKILCNKLPVCKSRSLSLSDSFTLDVNEVFSIQLLEVPKFLSVEVVEHPKGLLNKKICEVQLEIPNENVLHNQSKMDKVLFEKKEIVHYKHSGVGSGSTLKKIVEESDRGVEIKMDSTEINTSGSLTYHIGWQTSPVVHGRDGVAASMVETSLFPEILDKWGLVDERQLAAWVKGRMPDPQDPKNFALFDYLEANEGGVGTVDRKEYFRLSPFADKTAFCKLEAINQNVRLQFLKLRDQNEIEFDGITVPNRVREIPFALMTDYRKRKAIEEIDNEEDEDDVETLRSSGKRHLKQIYTRIFQTCKGSKNNLSYESVVDEKYLIYFEQIVKTSLKNLLNWFKWQPGTTKPLPVISKKPYSGPANQNSIRLKSTTPNKIVIKILSAKNIPMRVKHNKNERKGPVQDQEEARPCLEVCYEDFLTRTSVGRGTDPVWNELVELPLNFYHTDYTNPNSLNGSIQIDIFDTVNVDEVDNGKDLRLWLGEVNIPLSAVTTGLNLQGWFKVKLPSLLLGYDTYEEKQVPKSPRLTNFQSHSTNGTYLELELSMSPSVPCLEPNMMELPCNDLPYVKDHVLKWNEAFNSSYPHKKFNALVIDSKGRTNCITRYIKALEPPQLNAEEFDVTPEQCLRYVSLIPFTDCSQFYQNVWLTTNQLLSFTIGSATDHAVAVTCFLLALNVEAWLLLGYGVPRGSTAYALATEYTRDTNVPNYYLYDVISNEKFNVIDPHCPLQRVYCLVNGDNVWGNTQRTEDPALLRFDLSRKTDWWPLFTNTVTAPTNFLNNKITYEAPKDLEALERQLERKLKRKISKWRQLNRTTFNLRVSEAFKGGMRSFELNAMYGRSNTEAVIELNKATSQYNVSGVALNTSFTNTSSIVKKIKQLNLHIQSSDVTDFALSVLIQSYPGSVLSLWIFFGTVQNKSNS